MPPRPPLPRALYTALPGRARILPPVARPGAGGQRQLGIGRNCRAARTRSTFARPGIPPDPTFFSGYALRSADNSLNGPLIGLSIGENGAFGNCTMQYTLAVHLAQLLKLPFIKISENDRSELIRWEETLVIAGITFIPADAPLPAGGLFLHGFFFDPAPFRRLGVVSDVERHQIVRRYVRRLFNVLPTDVPAKPADQLMLHIRSGDIFDKWVNPEYVQPPLAFYIKVVDLLRQAGLIRSAVLVYENKLNL